jgi:hypothetical protein
MAVKAVNDLVSPDSLVPTLLIFSTFLRITDLDDPAPTISQRATAIRKAIEEITKIRAKLQVNTALNTRNRPITKHIHNLPINSDVLV